MARGLGHAVFVGKVEPQQALALQSDHARATWRIVEQFDKGGADVALLERLGMTRSAPEALS